MPYDQAHWRDIARQAPYPIAVMAAGIIWIFLGGWVFLSLAAHMFVYVLRAPMRGASTVSDLLTDEVGGMVVALAIILQVIAVGIQSIRGAVKGTFGIGSGSLLVALAVFCCGCGALIRGVDHDELAATMIGTSLVAVFAPGFLTAGILAIKANDSYLVWRRSRESASCKTHSPET